MKLNNDEVELVMELLMYCHTGEESIPAFTSLMEKAFKSDAVIGHYKIDFEREVKDRFEFKKMNIEKRGIQIIISELE